MKKIFAMLLVLTLILTAVICMSIGVSAESMYIRKIVSVVYDDSSSMDEEWAYANYAMQAFCGMLNSEDQLYITYMSRAEKNSNYQPEKINLSAASIQGSVDTIRKHSSSGSTPYDAVRIAYDKLASVKDDNPNTQYWLVVLTDGWFNEHYGWKIEDAKKDLDDRFTAYAQSVMPNGTNPQISFFHMGTDVVHPTQNEEKGIFVFGAENEGEITGVMSDIADKISGRTRLAKGDIKQKDSKTISVSSAMPLTNIVVFAQQSEAKIEKAICNNETDIPVSRQAALSFGLYDDLAAGAFMLGDAKSNIGSGNYEITFTEDVTLDNIVVLFEPALEMRTVITVNGKEIEDLDELDEASEGDVISISCKIYEMGTENEIAPSLMPKGTTFEIVIKEDGAEAVKTNKSDMTLSDYTLKNVETVLNASVAIEGFNPIDFSKKFTPKPYVPTITMVSAFGGVGARSIKLDNLAANKDMTICFTLLSDGVAITDKAAVAALNPRISTTLPGNDGSLEIRDDGVIVFTPNVAAVPSEDEGSYDVEITCTVDTAKGEVSAANTYTVLTADFAVVALPVNGSVKKTEFYSNTVGASFNITRDGVPMDKSKIENQFSVAVNDAYAEYNLGVAVSEDGTITVVPSVAEEHPLTFWNWFVNWAYYFGLPSEDVTLTLNHKYGTVSSVIDVTEEDIAYIAFAVALPLILELALLAFIIWWIYAIYAKPRFPSDAAIYYARLIHGGTTGARYHSVGKVEVVTLAKYNKLKYRWKPTLNSTSVNIGNGIVIAATGNGGSIQCRCQVWYKGKIEPKSYVSELLDHPDKLKEYIRKNRKLEIKVLSPYNANQVKSVASIDAPKANVYYVHTDLAKVKKVDGIETIEKGTIFAYARVKRK